MPLMILAFPGFLLTALPFSIMYLFTRLAANTEKTPDTTQAKDGTPQIISSSDECAKLIRLMSKRELEVVEAILAGKKRYKEISSQLNISVNTVKFHLKNIYKTTGVSDTSALFFLFRGYTSTPISPQTENYPKTTP